MILFSLTPDEKKYFKKIILDAERRLKKFKVKPKSWRRLLPLTQEALDSYCYEYGPQSNWEVPGIKPLRAVAAFAHTILDIDIGEYGIEILDHIKGAAIQADVESGRPGWSVSFDPIDSIIDRYRHSIKLSECRKGKKGSPLPIRELIKSLIETHSLRKAQSIIRYLKKPSQSLDSLCESFRIESFEWDKEANRFYYSLSGKKGKKIGIRRIKNIVTELSPKKVSR